MKYLKLGEINNYVGKNINPLKVSEEIFEMYSVPSFYDNYPEIVKGKDIGSSKQIVQKDDILLCKINPRINRVWMVSQFTTNRVIASSEWIVIRNKDLHARYLMWYFRSNYFRNMMMANVTGMGGSLMRAQPKQVQEYLVPIMDYANQIKIANILDKAQEVIDKRKEQIEALDQLVKSQFIEMFGDLKYEERLPLESCTTFIDYRGKTPVLSESGIRMINAKAVGTGFFKYIDEYISEETYNSWMKRGFPVVGDVLFVTEGHTFGNVCRIPSNLNKFAMGQRVITMQGKNGLLNNVFLAQYMQGMSFKIDIDKYKTGSSAQGIRSKELQKILIPIPDIELQNQFEIFVNQVDKLKFEMEKSLKELEDNFNALMQRAFKGEL